MRDRSTRPGEVPTDRGTSIESRRRPHWWRWILGGVAVLAVIAVAATAAVVELAPEPAPFALPKAAAAPSGPLDGIWRVVAGSQAGFRVRETIIGFSNDVTGRTSDVAGRATVSGAQVSSATFRVSLAAITVNGKTRQPQLVQSLGITAHPVATVTLTRPVLLPPAFSSGATVTQPATATLTLNGTSRPVTMTLSARRAGTAIEAAGSLPVTFADFGIKEPPGYAVFGSLADNGTAEFLLILKTG